jgi:hypothetical protein
VADAVKPGKGKQKGAQFEREVCVMLSRWLTDDKQEDVFWRSAMSGGRATVAYKKGKKLATQVGDISCIHHIGNNFIDNFAPECKYYAKIDFDGLVTGKGKLIQFWREINEQSHRYNKHPFLVCRQNRVQPYVCLDKSGMHKLGLRDENMSLISFIYDLCLIGATEFVSVCKPFIAEPS